jgi:hypothetical protein
MSMRVWSQHIIEIENTTEARGLIHTSTRYTYTHTHYFVPIHGNADLAIITGSTTGILHGRQQDLTRNLCNIIGGGCTGRGWQRTQRSFHPHPHLGSKAASQHLTPLTHCLVLAMKPDALVHHKASTSSCQGWAVQAICHLPTTSSHCLQPLQLTLAAHNELSEQAAGTCWLPPASPPSTPQALAPPGSLSRRVS